MPEIEWKQIVATTSDKEYSEFVNSNLRFKKNRTIRNIRDKIKSMRVLIEYYQDGIDHLRGKSVVETSRQQKYIKGLEEEIAELELLLIITINRPITDWLRRC